MIQLSIRSWAGVSILLAAGCATATTSPPRLRPTPRPPRAPVAKRLPADLFAGMQQRTQWLMGTRLRIALQVPPGVDADRLFSRCFATVRAVDHLLSDYRPQSPLSRLNAWSGRGWRKVDPALHHFLRESVAHSRKTGGAFDITVGALLTLRRGGRRPSARELATALTRTGAARVTFASGFRVRLDRRGVKLDPGGIGKGWALDRLIRLLRSQGVTRAFIDFGGSSFYGLGAPHGRRGWPVLVQSTDGGKPLGILLLRNASLSSSQSIRWDGKGHKRPHILDPRTGRLVRQARVAAVVAPSATVAEVLSTALVVQPSQHRTFARHYPRACTLTQISGKRPRLDPCARRLLTQLPNPPPD